MNSVSVSKPSARAGKDLTKRPAEDAIAREHVADAVAEDQAHHARQQAVAEAVARAVGGLAVGDAHAGDHIEAFVQQQAHHLGGGGGVVGVVAVHQHIHIGLDVGEHPPHHMALALQGFAPDGGAGGARYLGRAVLRVVVVDEDLGPRQGGAKGGDDAGHRHFFVVAGDEDSDARLSGEGGDSGGGHAVGMPAEYGRIKPCCRRSGGSRAECFKRG